MYSDILAQTFIVDTTREPTPTEDSPRRGCFLTSVDLFFASKDNGTGNSDAVSMPVVVAIHDTKYRYPGVNILPLSRKTLQASQINISADGSIPTNFKFDGPVFVEEDNEYAIVVTTQSTEYSLFLSEIGGISKTGSRIVSQPNTGQLFLGQNGPQWKPNPDQDLKFVLYRAKFDTTKPGSFGLLSDTQFSPSRRLIGNPFRIIKDSNKIRVHHKSHSMPVGSLVKFSGAQGGGGILDTDLNRDAGFTISDVLTDTYMITAPTTATRSDRIGGSSVFATEDLVYDNIYPNITYENFATTDVKMVCFSTSATLGSSRSTTPVEIDMNSENILEEPKAIKSYTNVVGTGAARRSIKLLASLSTTSDLLSPIIDLNRCGVQLKSFRIENATQENAIFLNDSRDVVVANTKIAFSGNTITSTHPDVTANLLLIYNVGKTILISGAANPTNNGLAVVSMISDDNGTGTIEVFDKTFTTESAGAPITIKCYDRFKDERAYEGGSAIAKYVTKAIEFENISEFLKVLFAAYVPEGTYIDLYYRCTPPGPIDNIASVNWTYVPMPENVKTGLPYLVDVEYNIDTPAFKTAMIKIVFRSTSTSKIPYVKDLRLIACP